MHYHINSVQVFHSLYWFCSKVFHTCNSSNKSRVVISGNFGELEFLSVINKVSVDLSRTSHKDMGIIIPGLQLFPSAWCGLPWARCCLVMSSLWVVVTKANKITSSSISEHKVDLAGSKVVVSLCVGAVLGSEYSNKGSVGGVSVRSPHISPHQTLWSSWDGASYSPLLEEGIYTIFVLSLSCQLVKQESDCWSLLTPAHGPRYSSLEVILGIPQVSVVGGIRLSDSVCQPSGSMSHLILPSI